MNNELLKNAFNFNEESNISSEENKRTARKIRKLVDINNIKPNPNNRFSMLKDAEYIELETLIKTNGQDGPIKVKDLGENQYMILSGHRRYQILKNLGFERIEIETVPEIDNRLDELVYIMSANMGTRQKKPFDMALSIKDISTELADKSQKEKELFFTSNLGISRASYYNYIKLNVLPDALLELGHLEVLTAEDARFLADNLNESELESFAEEIFQKKVEGMSEKDTKMLISNMVKNRRLVLNKKKNGNSKISKLPNISSLIKKIENSIDKFNFNEYTLPKQAQKKENTIKSIDSIINKLQEVKSQLKE